MPHLGLGLIAAYCAASVWAAIIINEHATDWILGDAPLLLLSPALGWFGKRWSLGIFAFVPVLVALPWGYPEDFPGSDAITLAAGELWHVPVYLTLIWIGVGLQGRQERRRTVQP